jgi:hypothetical protein
MKNMGRPQDMMQRKTLSQVDDLKQCNHIKAACKNIYKHNTAVNGLPVKRLLDEDSLVPTMVWYLIS